MLFNLKDINFRPSSRSVAITAEFILGPYDAVVLSTVSSATFVKISILLVIASALRNIL